MTDTVGIASGPDFDPRSAEHIFIINPVSFQRKPDLAAVIDSIPAVLDKHGCDRRHIHVSRYPRDAIGAVSRYLNGVPGRRSARVYSVGGDGILFDCLNAVMGLENVELAVIPYGRENDFVRAFGSGAADRFKDIGAQLVSPSIPTDVIYCDGNYAINFCAVGLEPASILWRTDFRDRHPLINGFLNLINKKLIYFISNYAASRNENYFRQNYNITADGGRLDGVYSAIHISNGPCYCRFMTPTGKSVPDDGLLELVTGFADTKKSASKLLPLLCYGRHYGYANNEKIAFGYRPVRELTISSDEPLIINLDGEMFYDSSMNVKIIPGGVRIVAPDGARYSGGPAGEKICP